MTDPVLMIRSLVRPPAKRNWYISAGLHSIGLAGIAIEQLKFPCPLINIESGAGLMIFSFAIHFARQCH